jgi:glycosyltransferase involved in cell wall biosynthesis
VNPVTPPVIVTVTPMVWQAGLEQALVAVDLARRSGPPFRYAIYGQGPAEEQVRYTIHDLDLSEVVTLNLAGRELQSVDDFTTAGIDGYLHTAVVPLSGTGFEAASEAGIRVVRTAGAEPGSYAGWEVVVEPWDPPAMASAISAWYRCLEVDAP